MVSLFDTKLREPNPNFSLIRDSPSHASTRRIMDALFSDYVDNDGHFITDFQGHGFDARIWELYLYACFRECGLKFDNSQARPDFCLRDREAGAFFVEAVTTGRETPLDPNYIALHPRLPSQDDQVRHAVLLARAIRKKVNKRYEQMPWVGDRPLAIALAPFHDRQAHEFSGSELASMLYGLEPDVAETQRTFRMTYREKKEAQLGEHIVRYGLFADPTYRRISAVVFSNSGTISKFHRIAHGCIPTANTEIFHVGARYDAEPTAITPLPFHYRVGERFPAETWCEGLTVYHNPQCPYPLPRSIFGGVMHVWLKGGRLCNSQPDFHPICSRTLVLQADADEDVGRSS